MFEISVVTRAMKDKLRDQKFTETPRRFCISLTVVPRKNFGESKIMSIIGYWLRIAGLDHYFDFLIHHRLELSIFFVISGQYSKIYRRFL